MNNNNNNLDRPDRVTSMINMQDRMLSVGGTIPERYQTAGNILGQANVERVVTQALLGQEKAVYKEIAKGIVLHKIQMPLANANDGAEMKYIFKVSPSASLLSRYNRRQ